MQILHHRPSAPLAVFIDQFWYRCGHVPDRKRELALPTGNVDVTFNLVDGDVGFDGAVVHGAQSRYFVIDPRRHVHVLGVHFRPGGGAALLGLPAVELTDRHVPLSDIWGSYAQIVRERLLEAATPQAKFEVLEREFMTRLPSSPVVHPAISFALRGIRSAPTAVRIAALQTSTGYGSRRFTTLFTDTVGMTPKLYSRIQRMRQVVERLAQRPVVDWADLASECGYYDQSHLIRDFREFSGVTPAEYRPVSASRALHMEIGD